MALWRLATGIDYRSIGQLFDVGQCTCCKVTHEVCQVILDLLLPRLIAVASGERVAEVKQGFLIKIGLQQRNSMLITTTEKVLIPSSYREW